MINYKEFLEKGNPKDFDYCNHQMGLRVSTQTLPFD